MDFCRTVECLYAALPLRPVRDLAHPRATWSVARAARTGSSGREEARGLLVRPDQAG